MVRNFLKIAFRNLFKHKFFSLINISGLAIGLASCVLLLLYVLYQYSYDSHFEDHENIYVVLNNHPAEGQVNTTEATPAVLAKTAMLEVPGVKQAVRISDGNDMLISYRDNSFKKRGLFADSNFFSLFSYEFIKGDVRTALKEPRSVVITRDLAKVLFGNEDPINKIVTRNNKNDLLVTGVIENIPLNSTYQVDYIIPWSLIESEEPGIKNLGWDMDFCTTVLQLNGPDDLKTADQHVRKLINTHQSNYKGEAFLHRFDKWHLYSKFEDGKPAGGLIDQVRLLFILAFSILLIACINFVNLSTARSEERAKEIGIRKTIGSSRGALIGQFLYESILVAMIAVVLSIGIIALSLPFFDNILRVDLKSIFYNAVNLPLILALGIVTGLVAGSYPAFYFSSLKPLQVLKAGKIINRNSYGIFLRKSLVVLQFIFSVCLVIFTGTIYSQIKFVQDKPIGYNKDNLVEINIEHNLINKVDFLRNELLGSGAVASVVPMFTPITKKGNEESDISWPGKRVDEKIYFDFQGVGYGFSKTAGLTFLEGRDFSPEYPSDTAGIIINETAVKALGLGAAKAVGSRITVQGRPASIVGVFKDFIWGSPYIRTSPMIVFFTRSEVNFLLIRLDPQKSIASSVQAIQKTVKNINPAYPLPDVKFVDQEYERKFENERLLGQLANIFGGLAIFTSCLGLYGLAMYSAAKRRKETSIRKVLGASSLNIIKELSAEYLKLVAIAIIIAFPLAWLAMHKWLDTFEYRVGLSAWIFAGAGILSLSIALVTVGQQAYRSAVSNPVKSLRSDD